MKIKNETETTIADLVRRMRVNHCWKEKIPYLDQNWRYGSIYLTNVINPIFCQAKCEKAMLLWKLLIWWKKQKEYEENNLSNYSKVWKSENFGKKFRSEKIRKFCENFRRFGQNHESPKMLRKVFEVWPKPRKSKNFAKIFEVWWKPRKSENSAKNFKVR